MAGVVGLLLEREGDMSVESSSSEGSYIHSDNSSDSDDSSAFHFMDAFENNEDGEYFVALDGRGDEHNVKDIKVKYVDDEKENLVLNRGHSYFFLDNLSEEEKKRFVTVGAQILYIWMSMMNLWQTEYEKTMRENRNFD